MSIEAGREPQGTVRPWNRSFNAFVDECGLRDASLAEQLAHFNPALDAYRMSLVGEGKAFEDLDNLHGMTPLRVPLQDVAEVSPPHWQPIEDQEAGHIGYAHESRQTN